MPRLPTWLLKRRYPQSKIQKEIIIDTRTSNPIEFSLNSEIPYLTIYLTTTNQSIVDLHLTDMYVEVWGGGTIAKMYTTEKPTIRARKQGNVHFKEFLSQSQTNYVHERVKKYGKKCDLYITAYFESKVGKIIIDKYKLENRQFDISGLVKDMTS